MGWDNRYQWYQYSGRHCTYRTYMVLLIPIPFSSVASLFFLSLFFLIPSSCNVKVCLTLNTESTKEAQPKRTDLSLAKFLTLERWRRPVRWWKLFYKATRLFEKWREKRDINTSLAPNNNNNYSKIERDWFLHKNKN